jgi:hypothetical protein
MTEEYEAGATVSFGRVQVSFLPVLLAHAAARQGVMVTGYHKDGGGVPSD